MLNSFKYLTCAAEYIQRKSTYTLLIDRHVQLK